MNTIKAINDDKDKLKTLWNRIYELEAERQEISALFPDDATHKHEQTGESLYDNIQDALRDLAKAKADLAAAREDVARMDWLEELHPHDGLFGQSLQARELVHRSDGWSCGNNLLGGWFGGSTPRAAIAAARAGGGK